MYIQPTRDKMSFFNARNSSGLTIPTERYESSIIEAFPRIDKSYKVESGVQSRYDRDYLPTNSNLFNGHITDNFIEFNLNCTEQEFIDLSAIQIEVKVRVCKPDGSNLTDDSAVSLTDGFLHRLFKSHSLFLNSVQVEGCSEFGLYNTIKTYLNMSKSELQSRGRNMLYKSENTKIVETITDAYFVLAGSDEKTIISQAKGVIHAKGPLMLDICDVDTFLLNDVNIRLRFELSPASLVLLCCDGINYSYTVELAKIYLKKIVPITSALVALNKTLIRTNASIQYIFPKPVIKSYIFPANHSTLIVDSIFQGLIPHTLIMFMCDQGTVNGDYARNPAYLPHNAVSNVKLELNGNVFSNLHSAFPTQIADVFDNTLSSINTDKNLLSYANFQKGRSIFVYDMRASNAVDTLEIERSGNLRISIQTSTNLQRNQIVYFVGIFTGSIDINADRRVYTNYLQ